MGRFICHEPQPFLLPTLFFLATHAQLHIPGWGTQDGNSGAAGFRTADPIQHWLPLQQRVPISGKREFSPFFSPFS